VPPPPRTKWTRRVPRSVLIGHAASLSQAFLETAAGLVEGAAPAVLRARASVHAVQSQSRAGTKWAAGALALAAGPATYALPGSFAAEAGLAVAGAVHVYFGAFAEAEAPAFGLAAPLVSDVVALMLGQGGQRVDPPALATPLNVSIPYRAAARARRLLSGRVGTCMHLNGSSASAAGVETLSDGARGVICRTRRLAPLVVVAGGALAPGASTPAPATTPAPETTPAPGGVVLPGAPGAPRHYVEMVVRLPLAPAALDGPARAAFRAGVASAASVTPDQVSILSVAAAAAARRAGDAADVTFRVTAASAAAAAAAADALSLEALNAGLVRNGLPEAALLSPATAYTDGAVAHVPWRGPPGGVVAGAAAAAALLAAAAVAALLLWRRRPDAKAAAAAGGTADSRTASGQTVTGDMGFVLDAPLSPSAAALAAAPALDTPAEPPAAAEPAAAAVAAPAAAARRTYRRPRRAATVVATMTLPRLPLAPSVEPALEEVEPTPEDSAARGGGGGSSSSSSSSSSGGGRDDAPPPAEATAAAPSPTREAARAEPAPAPTTPEGAAGAAAALRLSASPRHFWEQRFSVSPPPARESPETIRAALAPSPPPRPAPDAAASLREFVAVTTHPVQTFWAVAPPPEPATPSAGGGDTKDEAARQRRDAAMAKLGLSKVGKGR